MTEDLLDENKDEGVGEEGAPPGKGAKIKAGLARMGQLAAKRKKWLVLGMAGVMLVILLASVWFFFMAPKPAEDVPLKADAGAEAPEMPPVEEVVFEDIVKLDPFTRIRLADGSALEFLNVDVALELMDYRFRRQVFSKKDRIRDIITTQFREIQWAELRNASGKIRLKYAVLKRINSVFPKPMVRNLYFTNFIMQ